jgi:hypothetical protein
MGSAPQDRLAAVFQVFQSFGVQRVIGKTHTTTGNAGTD